MNRIPIIGALIIVVAGAASTPFLFDRLDSSLDPVADSEAEVTEASLISLTGIDGQLVALIEHPTRPPEAVAADVESLDGVATVTVVPSRAEPDVALIVAGIGPELDDDEEERLVDAFTERVEDAGSDVLVGGSLALDEELGSTAESDLIRADAATIPIVLLLLGLVLGGFRAALLPVTIVAVVIVGSLAVLMALTVLTTVSVFAVNVTTLFGVGLAVDYGLLIVSRFREEITDGTTTSIPDAVEATRATAGRAVIYSGLTVATSLGALLVFREPTLRSLAYGGIAATLLAVAAGRWLLPPMLLRWGHRLRPLTELDPDRGLIASTVRRIQRRPAIVATLAVAALATLAAPLESIRFEGLDVRSLPVDSPSRQLTDRLASTHPELTLAPITVLVEAPADSDAVADLVDRIERVAATGALVESAGDHTVVLVAPPGPAASREAIDLVWDLRSIDSSVDYGVTGEAAEEADLLDSIGGRLPFAAAVLMALTLALLLAFTRAPVVVLKAIAVNAISVAAAFGVLVWIFQHGRGARLLGFEPTGGLSVVILVLTFAFAFGLSMDYEVFLLARIREHFDDTGDNSLATVRGLQQSGRVVTQAALLIIIVFIGFAAGDLLLVKQLGIGLALAVLVDATLVRLLLVPALMTLLGPSNWR